jgi:hypothetical protein
VIAPLTTITGVDCSQLHKGEDEECPVYRYLLAKQHVRAGIETGGSVQGQSYDQECYD